MAVLDRRCGWRGIRFDLLPCGPGDPLPAADVYYLGGGQDRDQRLIVPDLLSREADLRAAMGQGSMVVGVCGGYQLLGHVYRGHHGDEMRGIGLVDLETVAGETRMIGNIVLRCELDPGRPATLVGFENHAGRTTLGPGLRPLGTVVEGFGNNGRDGGEGVHAGRALGTYVHGPLLPKNPRLADWLIREALEPRKGRVDLEPLDDTLEREAQRVAERIASR